MMLEQNDEWSLNRRYMQLEGLQTLSDTAPHSAVRCGSLSTAHLSLLRAVDLHHALGVRHAKLTIACG